MVIHTEHMVATEDGTAAVTVMVIRATVVATATVIIHGATTTAWACIIWERSNGETFISHPSPSTQFTSISIRSLSRYRKESRDPATSWARWRHLWRSQSSTSSNSSSSVIQISRPIPPPRSLPKSRSTREGTTRTKFTIELVITTSRPEDGAVAEMQPSQQPNHTVSSLK